MNASPARQVRWLVVLTLAMLPALPLTAVDWAPLRFLVGTWEGVGQGAALQGRGTVTFGFELGEGVLIRRNRTEI
ncbi:MAG TPA: hypothetical protein PKK12_11540, partial [Candidatus Aminicenantes bacterium]|nr:hypothetical protein [Candidatus Aminicenantes bacterium]